MSDIVFEPEGVRATDGKRFDAGDEDDGMNSVRENCYFKGTACPSVRLSVVPATARCVNRES